MAPDERTRPSAIPGTPLADAATGLDACVHCGFCLQACPTYLTLDDENDSPRGRLVLMRSAVDGELAVTDAALRSHIDRCLGCRACETACPSGVPYGHLLEATRETIALQRPIGLVARILLATMANDAMRRVTLGTARLLRRAGVARLLARLPGRLGAAFAMLEASRPALAGRPYAARGSGVRGRVALLTGCVMEGLFAETNRATERTLIVNDYELVDAPAQGCCGALHAHAGAGARARVLARRNIAAFERGGADFVVANAAGCGAMLREYRELLAHDPDWNERAAAFSRRVRDVSELLAEAGPRPGGRLELAVAYDAPCHLVHAQRVRAEPLAVLGAIPGLVAAPLPDSDRCCGGAGIYALLQPRLSAAVLAPKLASIEAVHPTLVATGNPGCAIQIGGGLLRRGSTVRCVHPVELLDASYARERTG